jgi:hypothetical protein
LRFWLAWPVALRGYIGHVISPQNGRLNMRASFVVFALLSACNADTGAQVPTAIGEWTRLEPMPEARTEVSVAAHGGLIYDVAAGTWSQGAPAWHA